MYFFSDFATKISDHDAALCRPHFQAQLFLVALKKSRFLPDEIEISNLAKLGCCNREDGVLNTEERVYYTVECF